MREAYEAKLQELTQVRLMRVKWLTKQQQQQQQHTRLT
jgi:hypothetical protein